MSVQSQIDRINENVANTYNALEGVGADMPNTRNTENLPETVVSIKAVRYDEQTLTEEQQAQARKNIGIYDQISSSASGETIVLTDSTNNKLEGLTLYGKTTQNGTPTPEAPVELVSAGDDGSVEVSVVGKNLIDYKTAIPRNSNSTVVIDESINGVHWYGDYFFYIPVNIPKGVNVKFSCESSGEDTIDSFNVVYEDETTGYNILNYPILTQKNVIRIQPRKYNTSTRNNVTVWDMQLEIGSASTDYEPYKKSQNLSVSTPNGLPGIPVSSGGNYTDSNGQQWICDEVDFTRGVHVQRVGRIDSYNGESISEEYMSSTGTLTNGATVLYILATPIETPLSAEQLLRYAVLHTNYPNTTILNDDGAGMAVSYVVSTKNYIDNQVAAMSAAILYL